MLKSQGGMLVNRTSALIKETSGVSCLPPPGVERRPSVRKLALTRDTESSGTLALDSVASRTGRNVCLVSSRSVVCLLRQPLEMRTGAKAFPHVCSQAGGGRISS